MLAARLLSSASLVRDDCVYVDRRYAKRVMHASELGCYIENGTRLKTPASVAAYRLFNWRLSARPGPKRAETLQKEIVRFIWAVWNGVKAGITVKSSEVRKLNRLAILVGFKKSNSVLSVTIGGSRLRGVLIRQDENKAMKYETMAHEILRKELGRIRTPAKSRTITNRLFDKLTLIAKERKITSYYLASTYF